MRKFFRNITAPRSLTAYATLATMRGYLAFEFSRASGEMPHKGRTSMTDWFDDLAQRFERDYKQSLIDKEWDVQQQRLIDANSGDLWRDLKREIQSAVASMNLRVDGALDISLVQLANGESIRVTYNRKRGQSTEVSATYGYGTHKLTIQSQRYANDYRVVVTNGNNVAFSCGSPTEVAAQILKQLL
jgi:hypothetical protein